MTIFFCFILFVFLLLDDCSVHVTGRNEIIAKEESEKSHPRKNWMKTIKPTFPPEINDFYEEKQTVSNSKDIEPDKIERFLFSDNESAEAIQSKTDCISHTVEHLKPLIKELSLPFKTTDINKATFQGKRIDDDKSTLTRIFLVIVLEIKHLLPNDYDGKVVEKVFLPDSTKYKHFHSFFLLSLKTINIGSVERAKLVQITENHNERKTSRVQLGLEIDFMKRDFSGKELNDTNQDFSNRLQESLKKILLFDRKWEKKSLKFEKFGLTSIVLGSALSLISSILCGLSFALKKKSLINLDKARSYYRDKAWWIGHFPMMLGDLLHFISFYFAPAIVICTLQMLTVLVAAIASSTFINEKINKYGKLAFGLCLGGCWVIVFHIPNEPYIGNAETLLFILSAPLFLFYLSILCLTTFFMLLYGIPKWGKKNSLAYTIQSAIFGSMIVIGMKGIVIAFTDSSFHWLPWVCLLISVLCLFLQLEYLNKALMFYNSMIVTTQYYVLYSALVILASSLLFKVWKTSSSDVIVANFCGFTTIILGILIFTIFQEDNASFDFSKLFA